jgi:hypothetical protein
MKKITQVLFFLTFTVIVSATTISAQSAQSVDADVPFNFNVGDETYAAGSYKIQILADSAGGSVITINDKRGNNLKTVLATQTGNATGGKSELVFERRGNERYLVGISLPEHGLRLAGSMKKERTEISRNTSSESKAKRG